MPGRKEEIYLRPIEDDLSGRRLFMITIATFSKPEDAHLLRMRLESRGIPAYLRDENIIQIEGWWASNAFGGVRLDVADEDFDAAKAILAEEPEI